MLVPWPWPYPLASLLLCSVMHTRWSSLWLSRDLWLVCPVPGPALALASPYRWFSRALAGALHDRLRATLYMHSGWIVGRSHSAFDLSTLLDFALVTLASPPGPLLNIATRYVASMPYDPYAYRQTMLAFSYLGLSLFIVVLGFAPHPTWSKRRPMPFFVVSPRVNYRAACTGSELLVSVEHRSTLCRTLACIILKMKYSNWNWTWYTMLVLIPDVEIELCFFHSHSLALRNLRNLGNVRNSKLESSPVLIAHHLVAAGKPETVSWNWGPCRPLGQVPSPGCVCMRKERVTESKNRNSVSGTTDSVQQTVPSCPPPVRSPYKSINTNPIS